VEGGEEGVAHEAAVGCGKKASMKDEQAEAGAGWRPAASGLERVKQSMDYVRNYMERGGAEAAKKEK
jgi:hypothetical protein